MLLVLGSPQQLSDAVVEVKANLMVDTVLTQPRPSGKEAFDRDP
jgi:hypothetical protein